MDDAKERHAQLGVFVLRLFPTIVQLILKDNITPGKLKRMFLDKTLNTELTVTDIGLMEMLPNMDDFTIEICYKILRFENLIGEPKCKWGNIPHDTEIAIADDIQRILNASNEVITKTSEEITKMLCDSYVDNVKRIIGRVDAYLNGKTCQQSYQNLHNKQITVSELLQILEEIILKHPIKVIPSIMTTAGTTMMRELYSRIAIVVTEIFPDILRDILQSTISPQDMYKKCDKTFLSSCFPDQQTYLKTLKLKNSFSFLDIPIIYKLFRYFSLISPPSKGWGKAPDPTDRLIADDIERIRTLRNEIAHRCDAKIDKNTCDAFFVRFCEICERIDIYFTGKTNYEQSVIDCRMCPLDIQMQTKYENAVKELENLKLHYKRKPVNFYWGDTFEKNLMNLRKMFEHEQLEGNEQFRVQIVLQTESDMNDRTVSILNSLSDEINQGLNGINFVFASSGSIVLWVDILVDEMQTDEKMQLVLYSFMNTIIETKIVSVSSAGYVDVVLIYSEENTFFEMTKKEMVTSSVVNLDFNIDARHFETDEKMKAALIDIVDNVYKKSNGSGTTGEIKATVMPLVFDFAEEIVSELKEHDKSTQENTDTRHDFDHFDADIKYEKKYQGNADVCDYSEEQVTYAQVAKDDLTALHHATSQSNTEMFRLLIENGIDVNLQDKDGNTALHLAVSVNNEEMVNLLLNRNCNTNIPNHDGQKPIDMVIQNAKIRQLFKKKKTQYQQVSQQASQEDHEQKGSQQVLLDDKQVSRPVSQEDQSVSEQDQLPTQLVQHEQEEKQGEQQSRTTFTQRRSIFIAITGNSFLYGYNMAVLNNPAMTIIAYYNKTNGKIPSDIETREYVDNDYTINLLWSFVTAVYVLVGVFGAWSAEKIAAKFGRRKPMMYNTILGIIASAIGAVTIYSDNIFILILHRMIIGFYCGIGLILSGMYAMEISNFTLNKVKGSYGTYDRWFQLSITAGICVSSFLGISTILGHRDRWQWLLILNVVPVLFNLFLYKCPDSPIYILLQDDPKKIDKARKALKLLCPPNEVVKELDRLKDEVLTEDVLTLKKIRKLFSKPEFRVGLFLVCFLQIAQQLSGINIVIAYSSFIYQGSGVEIELIEWMVFGTTLMNFFTTPISLSVQEKGRRAVLLITTVFMGVALFMLFMTGLQCENSGNVCPYFAIVPVFAYIVLFSLGLGPIPYIIVQELFEQDAQGAAFNVSVALHWLCNFLVMFCFRSLQMSMESYVYLMFSGIVLVLCGIMYKILPETKNKTMTEIKNSKEYKFALTWLRLQTSGTIQSGNSAAEDDRLL